MTQAFPSQKVRSQHTLLMSASNQEYPTTSTAWVPALPTLDRSVTGIRFGIRGGNGQLRYAYQSGQVANSQEPFALRPAGYYEALNEGIPQNIYFATDTANAVLELEVERLAL